MAGILNIETSTTNCSVSLAKDGRIVGCREQNDARYSHSENLHAFIKQLLNDAGISFEELDAVAVSKGPGSYTGLRIGVSAAKGLCFALNIPLIAVGTLHILSLQHKPKQGYIVPLLDARRMEVYSAIFNEKHEQIRTIQAEVITSASFCDYLEKDSVYFLGPGAEKCKTIITHPNARFQDTVCYPSAREMAMLSEVEFNSGNFEDTAYFEPYYLKDFVAKKPASG